MIKKFDTGFTGTSSAAGTASTGSSSNKLILAVFVLGGLYLGYRYILKPMMDKNKEEKQ